MKTAQKTRTIRIGGKGQVRTCFLGGDMPILIQTMWKEPLRPDSLQAIVRKIATLEQLGCDILRFAVPDKESAEAFVQLSRMTSMPLVADIHFDYQLALRCMEGHAAKIRINPGNIGNEERVRAVIDKARATGTPIRIGINSGSIPVDLRTKMEQAIAANGDPQKARAEALVEAALREIAFFDRHGFEDIIVSMKASSVKETVLANELFASQSSIPLHLGVTEAGPLIAGIVKSTLAFSQLLQHNIGATIRVSLSDTMENELIAARAILAECGKTQDGVTLISCPRCGRNGFDVHSFVNRWQNKLLAEHKTITVAVMGCEVNGPGESRHADIGITGSDHSVLLFKHGQIIQRIDLHNLSQAEKITVIDAAFEKELASL
ncbi:MAG: (E)-4-hydroxy-3-methylbut-2-enyl-diphosphate synthase [Treponema sp.]